jgi:hypothetical protein
VIERFVRVRCGDPKGDLRALVEAQVSKITVQQDSLNVELAIPDGAESRQVDQSRQNVSLTWSKKPFRVAKGTVWEPAATSATAEGSIKDKETLLTAIGKARRWVNDLLTGADLGGIARQEGKSERYIRMLIPLAFISPTKSRELVAGRQLSASAVKLARAVPLTWQNDISAGFLRG